MPRELYSNNSTSSFDLTAGPPCPISAELAIPMVTLPEWETGIHKEPRVHSG